LDSGFAIAMWATAAMAAACDRCRSGARRSPCHGADRRLLVLGGVAPRAIIASGSAPLSDPRRSNTPRPSRPGIRTPTRYVTCCLVAERSTRASSQ